MRWHWHISDTTKVGAEKKASRLRRSSAHCKRLEFKVRVKKFGATRYAPRGHYEVQWYGQDSAI